MKIAMIGHKRIPGREGGIEIVVYELSKKLAEHGNTVVAYNRKGHHVAGKEFESYENLKECDGIILKNVFTFKNSTLNALVYSALATLRALFGGFDVIHFHAVGPSGMAWLPHFFGKKTVCTIHGLDWKAPKWGKFAKKYLLFCEKNACKYADEIIVLSDSMKEYYKKTYGRETVKIPNGITEPKRLKPGLISEKFGLEKDGYILFLGRIVPGKGIEHLINAYNNLKTDKKLVIAGGASHSEDYFTRLRDLSKNNENIIFTDFVQGDMLSELYSNCYIFVLPSELEGMPISLLEAMSYGNCCVTSDIPECTEFTQGKTFTFENKNEKALEEILSMLLENPEEVKKSRESTANYVCREYDWDRIADRTETLYRSEV